MREREAAARQVREREGGWRLGRRRRRWVRRLLAVGEEEGQGGDGTKEMMKW